MSWERNTKVINLSYQIFFVDIQGARGFPGTPGLPGIKGHRVSFSTFAAQQQHKQEDLNSLFPPCYYSNSNGFTDVHNMFLFAGSPWPGWSEGRNWCCRRKGLGKSILSTEIVFFCYLFINWWIWLFILSLLPWYFLSGWGWCCWREWCPRTHGMQHFLI